MQHKYVTRAFVLARHPLREQALSITLLTADLGLLRARTEGVRKPGAKLAHALQTLSEIEATVLRGKDGWRLSGAILERNWFQELSQEARERAGKRVSLILRLVQGEAMDAHLYEAFCEFLPRLKDTTEAEQDAAEFVITLKALSLLGHDAGPIPSEEAILAMDRTARLSLISRINHGLEASGL